MVRALISWMLFLLFYLFHQFFQLFETELSTTDTQKLPCLYFIDELSFEPNSPVCYSFAGIVYYFFLEASFKFLFIISLHTFLPVLFDLFYIFIRMDFFWYKIMDPFLLFYILIFLDSLERWFFFKFDFRFACRMGGIKIWIVGGGKGFRFLYFDEWRPEGIDMWEMTFVKPC